LSRQRLPVQSEPKEEIREIEIDKLVPGTYRLRPVDQGAVKELARSIAHIGLLQPILVRQISSDHFQVIFGLHRLQACRQLGMTKVKAIVKPLSGDDAFLASVAENLQRNADIDAFEEARGYQSLIAKGWTQTEISQRIGKSDSYVSDKLSLIRRLHPRITVKLEENRGRGVMGIITASHAQRLARVKDPARQLELASLIEEAKLSVRDLENVLSRKSARGRFFLEVKRNFALSVPTELAKRLGVSEGDVLEARIRHGRLSLAKLHGMSLLRLRTSTSSGNETVKPVQVSSQHRIPVAALAQ